MSIEIISDCHSHVFVCMHIYIQTICKLGLISMLPRLSTNNTTLRDYLDELFVRYIENSIIELPRESMPVWHSLSETIPEAPLDVPKLVRL